ncbi:MAG TPA: hypothetical protein VJG90_00995 [Candidatus Nanoarchaeia archaeon]|nr:hypothetical protein [Candidatus Nanoarchaeia archaeon]
MQVTELSIQNKHANMNLKTIIFSLMALSYGTDSNQHSMKDKAKAIHFHMLVNVEECISTPDLSFPPSLSFRERFGYEIGSDEWRRNHYYRGNFVGFFSDDKGARPSSNKPKHREIPREYTQDNWAITPDRTQMNAYKGPYTVKED